MKLLATAQNTPRLGYLLFIPYLLLNSLLLFIGLKVTDFIFLTPLHAMMLRLSGGSLFRYAAIMVLEATVVSGLHLVFVLFFRRRLKKPSK